MSRPVRTQWPFALVLGGVLLGLARAAQYHWREGAAIVGAALLLGAGLRAVLPSQQAGLLVVRRRAPDVLTYGGLGLLVLAVALTITGGPLAD